MDLNLREKFALLFSKWSLSFEVLDEGLHGKLIPVENYMYLIVRPYVWHQYRNSAKVDIR